MAADRISCRRSLFISKYSLTSGSKYLLTAINPFAQAKNAAEETGVNAPYRRSEDGRSTGSADHPDHGSKTIARRPDAFSALPPMSLRPCASVPPSDPHRPDSGRQNQCDVPFEPLPTGILLEVCAGRDC